MWRLGCNKNMNNQKERIIHNLENCKRMKKTRHIGWKTLWFVCLALFTMQTVTAQNRGTVTLSLKDEPLPSVLKQIERAGEKSILFAYEEAENYRVTADIRRQTQAGAIRLVLANKPFQCVERGDYFVIRRTDETNNQVHGTVLDERNEPLAYANVLILSARDSSFVTGCVTADDGTFVLPLAVVGPHLLKVTYVGYHTLVTACQPENTVRLSPDAQLLGEVTVTAQRPLVDRKNGNVIANVVGTPLSQMGSVADMIGHLPFVTGSDGSYSVIGRRGDVEIYINSRKVRDNSELDQLQANEIVSAEIIMNPGARYRANTGAVIRIRTIRRQGDGLSGNFYVDYTRGHKARAREGASFNYRRNGLDVFIKGHFKENNSYSTLNTMLEMNTSSQWRNESNTTNTDHQAGFNGEVGFNYEPDTRQSFGVRYVPSKGIGAERSHGWGETFVYRDGAEYDRLDFVSDNESYDDWGHSLNAYYTATFGKWDIDFNADYLRSKNHSGQEAANNGEVDATSTNEVANDLYALRLVASVPLGKGKMTFGTEETFTNRHDIFRQSGFSEDADDHIRQDYISAFADYTIQLGKFSLQGGLRYEYQKTHYYEADVYQPEQSPVYNDWIPTFVASYQNKDWNASFSYRLQKMSPSYHMLSSAVSYNNKYQYTKGNPLLVPQKQHYFSLDGGWKWVNDNLYYAYILEMYTSFLQPYDDVNAPGVLLQTYASVPHTQSYGFNVMLTPKIGWWQPKLTTGLSWFRSDARSLGIEQLWNEPRFGISLDNSFTFPHGWFLNVEGEFVARARTSYAIVLPTGRVNARLSKSFLKDRSLQVSLVANDIFATVNSGKLNVYGVQTYQERDGYADTQRIGLRVSYRFNAAKNNYKGKGAGRSEKNRL